jgi:UDP-N-acetylglucosamine 4,6-dehydratase
MDTLLITGGTGTFGYAFARRVLDGGLAERVAILSRDEKKQADMARAFDDPRLRFYLGDVRDKERLERAFQGVDAVVHAASFKQVDRSGLDADEFFKTICLGALNVVEAAHRAGVKKVAALSTDKAVESVTPYGSFKSAAEWLFISGCSWGPAKFAMCRYGNIVNSRGSVLEIWREKVACGLPLPITDPTMTRFWLTIEQAVDLVLLALDRMNGGEIFIPKGVKRSSVLDLARAWYPTAEIEVVGKRSYEKMHEVLVADEERDRLRDCGDCYVLLPLHVRWEPRPYGEDGAGVGVDFQYRSDR